MKIEQVLVQQLYSNKEITLQGIGTFRLDNSVSLPVDSEKGMVIPENAISFIYNPKVPEDAALIDAIVQHTKKIKPLASADLDSYLTLGKQFLNIGKPFIIEGLGTLDKAQTGELIFIPGQFITPKIEPPKALKENENEEKSGLFPDYDSEVNSTGKKTLWIVIAVILLAAGAWAAYHFLLRKDTDEANENTQIIQNNDTSAIRKLADTTHTNHQQTVTDGYTFKIVFKTTKDKQEAITTLNKYKEYGHKVIMYTSDSVNYKVAEPFTLPLSDTSHIKDSLNRYYYLGKAHVEIK
ncbi:MAG: hypothetical protein M3004_00550 [Bacteroidota bacterium]|nr:hypothetical protein [Bacteroidota bacterium]